MTYRCNGICVLHKSVRFSTSKKYENGQKNARFVQYSLKHKICVVFVVIPFLEQSHVQAKTDQTEFRINNVKYILNTSIQ